MTMQESNNKNSRRTTESRDKIREGRTAKVEVPSEATYVEGSPVFVDSKMRYRVKRGEEHLVHIKMYVGPRFNQVTGAEVAQYRTQIFNVNAMRNFENNAVRLGYRYCFLHKPRGFKSKFEV